MLSKALIAVIGCVALIGCQTVRDNPNTAGGALLGAGAGAALGTLAGGDDRRNALVGAGIGLLAGGAIGAYLDEQERALERDLRGTGARIQRYDDRLMVVMPGNVTFATDSAEIHPRFVRPLSQVASTLQQYPKSFIDVIGHTDSRGSAQYNLALSEDRAQSVAQFFRDYGVYPGRIAAYGEGEIQPIATNATPQGRQQNRRVELVIIPAQEG